MLRKAFWSSLLCLLFFPAFSQYETEWGVGYSGGAPFYMRFYITEQFFHTARVTWAQQTDGSKDWHAYYNFPKQGVGVQYIQLGNRKTLGDAIGAYYFFELTLLKDGLVEFPIRFGGGLGYLTKTYQRKENYKNHSIGSHFNAMYTNYLGMRFNINKHIAITTYAGFTHFSNAGLKLPNRGVNFLNAGIDMTLRLNPDTSENLKHKKLRWNPRPLVYELFLLGGLRSVGIEYNRRFPAFVLCTRAFKPLNKIVSLGVGLDFSWDFSYPFRNKYAEGEWGNPVNGIKIGAHGSLGLNFDQVQFTVYAGRYFYKLDTYSMPIYMRMTTQYNFTPNWLVMFSFQAQQHKADHLSLGLGYRF